MTINSNLFSAEILKLSTQQPFGRGYNRQCFHYPGRPDLCVKVVFPGRLKELRDRSPFYKQFRSDRSFDDNYQELRAYQQRAIVKGGERVWDAIPRCYGWVATDIGEGLVSDFYVNDDGSLVKNLEQYIEQFGLSGELQKCIEDFENYLRDTLLLTKNLLPHNIVVVEENGMPKKLVLIDGFGVLGFFSLASVSRAVARRYIEKRISKMHKRIDWEASGRKVSWQQAERDS